MYFKLLGLHRDWEQEKFCVCPILSLKWQSRRTCAHLLRELQNYNSLLNNHWQENVGSHWKKIPHIQGQRRSPNKMVGGAKSRLESNPIPARDLWEGSNKILCTPGPSDPTETEPELCLNVSCGGTGQQWPTAGAGAPAAELSHSPWHKPSWKRSPLTPP